MFSLVLIQSFVFLASLSAPKRLKGKEVEKWGSKQPFSVLLVRDKECTECDKLMDDLSDVFNDQIPFGIVDSLAELPAKYTSTKYPAIKVIQDNGQSYTDYKDPITAADMFPFIFQLLERSFRKNFASKGFKQKETYVVTLTDSNFTKLVENSQDHYLVEFFAPWCGHCKALAPAWKEAAQQLSGKIKLAAVDCTVNKELASKFGIKGFPTIKFIAANSKDVFKAEEYNGGRSVQDIVTWVENKLQSFVPPPEFVQITSQKDFESQCLSQTICVLVFLPNRLDADAKAWKRYISTVEDAIKSNPAAGFGWVWLEGGVHDKIEEAVGVGGFGYPTLVALNYKKQAYSIMKRSFEAPSIVTFLRSLGSKSVVTEKLSSELKVTQKVVKWDGSELRNTDL